MPETPSVKPKTPEAEPTDSETTEPEPAGQQVAKSNRMIQGQFNWSKVEHRIVTMLIGQIDRDDEEFEMQSVYLKDILERSGVRGKGLYDRAERICDRLMDSKIRVRSFTEEEGRVYEVINPFSSCKYIEKRGEIRARFTKDMRPMLLRLKKRFTTYKLQNFVRLGSQYSMRIYELLKMREGLRSATWSVEELREVLSCEDKYAQFCDFKRRVLDRAQKEIGDICDIGFTYHVHREGRTPVKVTFTIFRSDREEPRVIKKSGTAEHKAEISVSGDRSGTLPRFDIEAMVRQDLTQDELDRLSPKELTAAVEEAKAEVKQSTKDRSETLKAVRAQGLALEALRAEIED
jgi:plasmid replication initiation protein